MRRLLLVVVIMLSVWTITYLSSWPRRRHDVASRPQFVGGRQYGDDLINRMHKETNHSTSLLHSINWKDSIILKWLQPSQRGDFSSGHTEGFSVSSSQSRRALCLFWQPPHQAGPAMLVDPKMFLLRSSQPPSPRGPVRSSGVKVG